MNSENIEGADSVRYTAEQIEELRARSNVAAEVAKMGPSQNNFLDEDTSLHQKLELFGTDWSQVPCFRNTFLYGILSGFGGGIGYFAFTSNLRKANSVAFYTMFGVIAVYWIQCRWNHSVTRFKTQQMQYALQQMAIYSGTDKVPKSENLLKTVNLDSPKDDEFLNKPW